MGVRGLRVRDRVSRWSGIALVACLLAAGAGGLLTYEAYVDPGTDEEMRTVTDGRVQGAFTHRATITDRAADTPFEPNATVEDRAVYFERVMPVLEGSFALAYSDADTPLDVTVRRVVVVESVESGDGDERTVFWRENRSVTEVERTVDPGGEVTVPFEVNVSEIRRTAENVSERIGSPGETRVRVVMAVVATQAGSEARTLRTTFALPIETEEAVYRPSGDSRTESFSRTVTERVEAEPGPLRTIGGPTLLALGLLGVAGLGLLFARGDIPLSETERAWLTYRDDRTDFEEWIHTLSLPDEAVADPDGEAATLGDLVDFAIDADAAVVEDPDRGAYFVFHQGRTFAYDPPETPAEADGGDGDDDHGDSVDADGDEDATNGESGPE